MRRGQTIVAERERAESDSERMQERKRVKRKHTTSTVVAILLLAVIGLLAYTTGKNFLEEHGIGVQSQPEKYVLKAQVVDEDNRGQISTRIQDYMAQLEQDLADLGYTMTKVILPTGTSRELYVDLLGEETYLKVNIDRGTAVTAEDADRVLRYLKENDLHPAYVDVRVEGKAYYK